MRNYLLLASILFISSHVYAQESAYYVIPKDVQCKVKKSNKITYCHDLKGVPITGEMRRYYNGDIKHSYTLKNGVLDGITETYYRDGTTKIQKIYKDGVLNGITSEYFKNGNIKEEASYVNGKKEGITKQYYENGKLMSQAVYKNNKVNGEYRIYDEDQHLVYNFKSTNSVLKSGHYYYKNAENKTKKAEIPAIMIKAISRKCVQIHSSLNQNPCVAENIQLDCNTTWYNKHKKEIDEYYKTCTKEQQNGA